MKIVAPAGNLERFYAAISAGAHEIYMGIKGFGARRNAVNLTISEYKEAIDYAHKRGAQVFLTLNTVMMDAEIEAIYTNLNELYKQGLDAVIVQDLGLAKFIKENFPKIALHGSTQMTVANHIEANYLKSIGFERVVLPRELSYDEIKEIRKNTEIELEIFVSGALCVSYSGNCYMSSFIGGRSGNRGMCAQPCRKKYKGENEEGYLLSPKDQMYGYEEIKKLKEIGIDSIKLEGRMKEPNYVFQMVNYYNNLISDNKVEEKATTIFNRGYGLGYFYNKKDEILNPKFASHIGKKLGILRGKELKLEETLILGDGIIFLDREYNTLGGTYINKIKIKNGANKKKGEIGEKILLQNAPKGTVYVYKNFSKEVKDETENQMKKQDKKESIEFDFYAKIGKKPKIVARVKNIYGKLIEVSLEGEQIVEIAKNRGMTKESIEEKLLELGETTFSGKVKILEIDNTVFLPVSQIKKLKRDIVEKISEKLILSYRRESGVFNKGKREENIVKKSILSAIVTNDNQAKKLKELGIEKIYRRGYDVAKESNLSKIDLNSKLASNLYQILENKNDKITVNWNLNITNRYALEEYSKISKIDTVILSPEVSFKKLEEIGETKIKKAILAYGKPKGMYLEISLKEKNIINEQGDKFIILKNDIENSEIFLSKPLNILSKREYLEKIGISELVLEFIDETPEEIERIVTQKNEYNPYNYEKGVF